ncbi:MAG: GntR family transcriptional regulator [Ktedonobacterales bacterium]
MEYVIDDSRPIFAQIAALYQINPATAAKGVNLLVDEGILYKKRGLGMYVATGSRERLVEKRREEFFDRFVGAMLQEAEKLGITTEQLVELVQRKAPVR